MSPQGKPTARHHDVTNGGSDGGTRRFKWGKSLRGSGLVGWALSLRVSSASMKSGPFLWGWMLHEYTPHHHPQLPPSFAHRQMQSTHKQGGKQRAGSICNNCYRRTGASDLWIKAICIIALSLLYSFKYLYAFWVRFRLGSHPCAFDCACVDVKPCVNMYKCLPLSSFLYLVFVGKFSRNTLNK